MMFVMPGTEIGTMNVVRVVTMTTEHVSIDLSTARREALKRQSGLAQKPASGCALRTNSCRGWEKRQAAALTTLWFGQVTIVKIRTQCLQKYPTGREFLAKNIFHFQIKPGPPTTSPDI